MASIIAWPRRAVAATLLLLPPATSAQAPVDPRGALVEQIQAASDASGRSGLAAGLDGVLAADAVLLYPGAPIVRGRAEVRSFLAAQPESLTTVHLNPLDVTLATDGRFALSYGVAALATPPGRPAAALRLGNFLAAWQRAASGEWQLSALALIGLTTSSAANLGTVLGRVALPPLPPSADPPGRFARADLAFAAMAGKQGAAVAFGTYAAADAVVFDGSLLARGPTAIRKVIEPASGPEASWSWYPVVAVAASSGDLGYTAGEAEIRAAGADQAFHSKYLTFWRRDPTGRIRFIADGGNARPGTAPVAKTPP